MTTPVGSIKLDLKIDGSGLPREILAEVKTALEPTLKDVRRLVNELQRDYTQLGRDAVQAGEKQAAAAKAASRAVDDIGDQYRQAARSAEESAVKQVAANRRVAESVDSIGDHWTKVAATAFASSRAQGAALQHVTREIDAQAAAWGRLAAARTAAAASPTPGGPGSGGGGGGRGGGGGGSAGRRGSGALVALGLNAAALGVASWPAAATAVTNLAGAIQQLVQVGGLVPGVVGGIVSSVGTLKLGFMGMEDAAKAAWEAAASGDPKDLKKAAEAMKNLAPAAQDAVKAMVALRPQFDHLQRDVVQQNMFAGLNTEITNLATKAMPTLEKGLGGISTAWNDTFKQLGGSLGSDSSLSLLDKLFGNTADAQTRANKAIGPFTHAIETMTAESSDFLPRLADGLGAVTTRFDTWITTSTQNGNLDRWIDQGIDATTNLGNAFLNVGKIINDLTTAAGGDGGFLKWLNDATGKLHEFLASDEGQAKLTAFFKEGREQLAQWAPILSNIATVAGNVYDGMKQWSAVLLPVLKQVTGVLADFPGLTQAAVIGFLAFKSLSVFGGLLGGLGSLNTGLKTATTSAGGLSGRLGSLAGRAAGIVSLGLAIEGLKKAQDLMNPEGGKAPAAAAAVGAGGLDIAGGAVIGAQVAGLPGAVVGAGVGAGKAVYDRASGDLARQQAQTRQNFEEGRKNYQAPPVDPSKYGPSIAAVTQQAEAAANAITALGVKITTLPNGTIQINDPTPEIITQLERLGLKVTTLPNGTVTITANTGEAMGKIGALQGAVNNVIGSIGAIPASIPRPQYGPGVGGAGGVGAIPRQGRANGGVLPGYSPGVDNMMVPMSGGEGVLIPEAVRALGPAFVYGVNAMFRPGLGGGYRSGGVVGFADGGIIPPGIAPAAGGPFAAALIPVIVLLSQIRDSIDNQGRGSSLATSQVGQRFVGGLKSGLGGVAGKVAGGLVSGVGGAGNRPLPAKTAESVDLLKEGNLAAIPSSLGYKVGDYSRKGGQGGDVTANKGPGFTSTGRVRTNTAALVDRSFTSLSEQMKASFAQLLDVMSQVRDQLVKIASNLASTAAGAAVSIAGGAATPGKAAGGPIWGGVPGRDSVPILAMPGEHMLTTSDVAAMGGQAGVFAFRRALHGAPRFADGGAVNANATVGADFFGVSQVPILGAIINMLISTLLSVIGVQIKARDTMVNLSDEFRQFRGDFKEFNAQGRLLNDTSGLVDRSGTSTEEAADERVKVLKIVIKQLIDYIIHNVIVPIAKATGKAAVAAGATAAGTAISAGSGAGGAAAGGIVSGLITAAGDAGVDIGAQVYEDFAVGLTGVLTDSISSLLQSSVPGLVQGIFGQGLSGLFPTGTINAPAMGGGLATFLAALLGTAAVFDDGGLATGTGLMPKATVAPERVLSPRQTTAFEQMAARDFGAKSVRGDTNIYMPTTVYGGENTQNAIHDRLLDLIDV